MNSTGISRVWHYGLQRKRNVASRCDRGSKSYDANQKRKHLPGFGVLPGIPGEAAESMFERRGHGQLLKKFGSYPDGRLPSGKKRKGRRERQPFGSHPGRNGVERKNQRTLEGAVWRSMRKSAGNEWSLVTSLRVLRPKPPDFAPAFTEAAFQRTKKKPARRLAKSSLSEGRTNLRERPF
jgi:hypothetical protein